MAPRKTTNKNQMWQGLLPHGAAGVLTEWALLLFLANRLDVLPLDRDALLEGSDAIPGADLHRRALRAALGTDNPGATPTVFFGMFHAPDPSTPNGDMALALYVRDERGRSRSETVLPLWDGRQLAAMRRALDRVPTAWIDGPDLRAGGISLS